ncbi:THUMP domain-containing protein 2 [Pelobates fuscus]|uniref:THUMP domain-containing protein 2 n=1 Tax=Pelobates fuscus TaxID=191477 RepID=UPI002FE4EEF0
MAETKVDCSPKRARFFCTAGRGLERFVTEEVTRKASAVDVESMSGKVFFTAEPDMYRLRQIKSGERLFLLLRKEPPLSLPKGKGNALSMLRETMVGESKVWISALDLWQNLQEPVRHMNDVQNDQIKASKRKLENDSALYTSKLCKKEHGAGEVCILDEHTSDTFLTQSENQCFFNDEQTNNIPPKTLFSAKSMFTFRVSCRCTGAIAKLFTAQELGRVIGKALVRQFGWKPDLRKPILEVFVHLNDLYSVVGFPIMRQPLANRAYIQSTGLRSTTAWAMVTLAEISAKTVVLDPMCGVGTILLEAAKEWPHVHFLGMDINASQLKNAVDNVKAAGVEGSVEFLKGSVLDLPILSESIDVVISDIPFGKKFASSKNMKELLPEILCEMERVVRIGGIIVLLLSQSLHHHLKAHFQFKDVKNGSTARTENDLLQKDKNEMASNKKDIVMKTDYFESLVPIEAHPVSLGVTEAIIFKCKKLSNP